MSSSASQKTSRPTSGNQSQPHLNTGQIVGAVAGGIIAVVSSFVLVAILICRKRARQRKERLPMPLNINADGDQGRGSQPYLENEMRFNHIRRYIMPATNEHGPMGLWFRGLMKRSYDHEPAPGITATTDNPDSRSEEPVLHRDGGRMQIPPAYSDVMQNSNSLAQVM